MRELQVFQYEGNEIAFDFGNDHKMINAAQMGKALGRTPKDFLRTREAQQYTDALSVRLKCLTKDLVKTVQGGDYRLQGTWMHQKLALRFAQWLSPQFALWVDEKIEQLLTTGVATVSNDDEVILQAMNVLHSRLQKREEQLQLANSTIALQAPKVDYYNEVLQSDSTYLTTHIAKEIGMSARELNKALYLNKVQYKQDDVWVLYAKYQDKGYTKTKTYTFYDREGNLQTSMQTVWTEKGRQFIHELFG